MLKSMAANDQSLPAEKSASALQERASHSQPYMRTRQKCNPEYIPLYLRSAYDQRSCLMDRANEWRI